MRTNIDIFILALLEIKLKVSHLYELVPESAPEKKQALKLKTEIEKIIERVLAPPRTSAELDAMKKHIEDFATTVLKHLGRDELGDDFMDLIESIKP